MSSHGRTDVSLQEDFSQSGWRHQNPPPEGGAGSQTCVCCRAPLSLSTAVPPHLVPPHPVPPHLVPPGLVPPHLVPPRWTFQWVSSQQLRPLSSGESEQTTVGRVEEATFPAGTPHESRTTERFPLGVPAAHRWSGPRSHHIKITAPPPPSPNTHRQTHHHHLCPPGNASKTCNM